MNQEATDTGSTDVASSPRAQPADGQFPAALKDALIAAAIALALAIRS